MNYSLLIENRRSVREFTDRHICPCALTELKEYYHEHCRRLDPSLKTALLIFGADAREKLDLLLDNGLSVEMMRSARRWLATERISLPRPAACRPAAAEGCAFPGG